MEQWKIWGRLATAGSCQLPLGYPVVSQVCDPLPVPPSLLSVLVLPGLAIPAVNIRLDQLHPLRARPPLPWAQSVEPALALKHVIENTFTASHREQAAICALDLLQHLWCDRGVQHVDALGDMLQNQLGSMR